MADSSFIEISRKWVCVRVDSYENQQYHDKVRELLGGRFENTAFALMDPDGETMLTRRGSRSPTMTFGSAAGTVRAMENFSRRYEAKDSESLPLPQDFHSLRQALNVSSADQRPLIVIASTEEKADQCREKIRELFSHPELIGRFHYDFLTSPAESSGMKGLSIPVIGDAMLHVVYTDEFGLSGELKATYSMEKSADDLIRIMKNVHKHFALHTELKEYRSHVTKGIRLNINYQNEMPYGEDRDGDGQIDSRQSNRRRPRPR